MEVILLERVAKLGQMGEVVRVRDGFARNYLLPRGKALRATEGNKKRFEGERAQLEARNLEAKAEAEKVGGKLDGKTFVVIRQAGESGQLYGSVSSRVVTLSPRSWRSASSAERATSIVTPTSTSGCRRTGTPCRPSVLIGCSAMTCWRLTLTPPAVMASAMSRDDTEP